MSNSREQLVLHDLNSFAASRENLVELRKSSKLCDVTLIVGDEDFRCHRIILAAASPYFRNLFLNEGFLESQQESVVIEQLEAEAFQQVLDFVYSGQCTVSVNNVGAVLYAADMLMIERLRVLCDAFLRERLDLDNCLTVWTIAESTNMEGLRDACKSLALRQFDTLRQSSAFLSIEEERLAELLEDDVLRATEWSVFEGIVAWAQAEPGEERREALQRLFKFVRLLRMTSEELEKVTAEPLVAEHHTLVNRVLHQRYLQLRALQQPDEADTFDTEDTTAPSTPHALSSDPSPSSRRRLSTTINLAAAAVASAAAIATTAPFATTTACTSATPTTPTAVSSAFSIMTSHAKSALRLGGRASSGRATSVPCSPARSAPVTPQSGQHFVTAIGGRSSLGGRVGGDDVGDRSLSIEGVHEGGTASDAAAPDDELAKRIAKLTVRGRVEMECMFALGGKSGRGHALNTIERYVPRENRWEVIGPRLITSRYRCAAVTVGDCIYVIGGRAGFTRESVVTVEEFHTTRGTVREVAPLIAPRSCCAAAALAGKVYVLGGLHLDVRLDTMEVYDPSRARGQWERAPSMHVGRTMCGAGVLHGHIYAVGGHSGMKQLRSVERFVPTREQWEPVAPMFTKRDSCRCAVLNGLLYAIGGYGSGRYLDSVERYDPARDCWEMVASMNVQRAGCGVAAIDGRIFVWGGRSRENDVLDSVEAYDPLSERWTIMASLCCGRRGSAEATGLC